MKKYPIKKFVKDFFENPKKQRRDGADWRGDNRYTFANETIAKIIDKNLFIVKRGFNRHAEYRRRQLVGQNPGFPVVFVENFYK